MDRRKSSLLIGSRTRKNVLKGKNIRKHDDGADNFADYWTDSNSEDSSSRISDKDSDISQAQKEPQNIRTRSSPRKFHSGTHIKDKQDKAKVLNSPFKAVKKLNSDKNIHSPTKKQKLSSKLQQDVYHNSTQNANNVSYSSGESFVGSESSSISKIQPPILNSTFLHKSTKNTDTSTLPKAKKVKSSQKPSSCSLTSKNNNEEVCNELNSPQPLDDALIENVSPSLTNDKEEKGTTYIPRRSKSGNLNEHFPPQLPAVGDNGISKCPENTLSPLRKQSGRRRKTIVMNKNVSDANLNASGMLSPMKVVDPEANLTNATGSEIYPLINKASNVRNSHMEPKENVSSIFKSSFGMRSNLHMSKAFAVYDEYDAKIIQMAQNSISLSINSPKTRKLRSFENKNKQHLALNTSKILPKSASKNGTETNNTSNNEAEVEAVVSHIDVDNCMSDVNEIQDHDVLVADVSKSKKSLNEVVDKLKSKKSFGNYNFEEAAEIPEMVKQPTTLDNKQKKVVSKIQNNSKASKTFSKDNAEDVLDTSEIENKTTANLRHKKGKHVNKIPENLNASKTISNNKNKNVTNISAQENDIADNFDNEKEKHVTETNKVKASETFSIENTEHAADVPMTEKKSVQNPKKRRKKHVSKIPEKLRLSKTSSKDTENAAAVLPTEKEISPNLDDERESCANNTHESLQASGSFFTKETETATEINAEKNVSQVIAIKRKKPVSKISENLKTSRIISEEIENIEIDKEVTPNLKNERKRGMKKNKEKQITSETFLKVDDSANEAGNGTASDDTKRKKRMTESCRNLSAVENNEKHVLPSKKKGKKVVSAEERASIRRSVRQKFPPLATWRNERILYRFEKGTINVIGIDKGTGEDAVTVKPPKRKEIKKRAPKKISVHDVINKKKVRISLVKNFDDVPWDKKYEACPYRIKRMFETESSVTGFIEIEANAEKPVQYMPNDDLYLTVWKGEIEINIQNDVILAEKKSVFIIPRCVPYSLKNVGSRRALLAFCVGRFQYIENNS